MPSSAVRIFSDPDDYAASIRAADAELTITGRGVFQAKLTRIDLQDLWMQRSSCSLPRIFHLTNIARRALVSFSARPGPPSFLGGMEIPQTGVMRWSDDDSTISRSTGDSHSAGMSLPVEVMVGFGGAVAGRDLTPPKRGLVLKPQSVALAGLRRLYAAAGLLAEEAPAVIAHPEAARGLEQALIEALVNCLGVGEPGEDRSALRQHAAIMRRFHRMVEANPDQALFIPEVCVAIGSSERTLRVCCQEQLGIGPKRYLLLRRMNLARRALSDSAPGAASVTEIATRYGFWQFGRFAAEYKSLFGELPSTALARSPG